MKIKKKNKQKTDFNNIIKNLQNFIIKKFNY